MGLFEKFKQGLKKTAQLLNTDIRDIFKGQGRLVDEAFLEAWFETLVRTDMGVDASKELVGEIRKSFNARVVEEEQILAFLEEKLKALLAQPSAPIRFAETGPTVIMVAGVNGCGKTTSIAKLAQMFISDGKKVIFSSSHLDPGARAEYARELRQRGVRDLSGLHFVLAHDQHVGYLH